jgi:aspartate/methionine/tyrosine aminotransferase
VVLRVAARGDVPPFKVMDVLAAAERRRETHGDLVFLGAGQPSTGAPRPVRDALRRVLDAQTLGYTEAIGRRELRERIAQHTRDWYGIEVDAADVVVTTGSSGAFLLAFLTAFASGDRIGMGRPAYPAYRNLLTSLGLEAALLPTGSQTRYQPTAELLERHGDGLDGLVVASPANPTGTMLGPAELAAVLRWCDEHGVRAVSDEIYHGIAYEGRATCAWETTRTAVVVGSFSKYFSMTGWRLGWLLAPEDLRGPIDRLTGNLSICAPAPAQAAAVAAFDAYPELDGHVRRYAANRAYLLEALPAIGLGHVAPPDGAFYVWADVSAYTDDSDSFWREMLAETGVALTPGTDFDPVDGRHWVRLSFASSRADLEEAVRRLGPWLAARSAARSATPPAVRR